MDISEITVAQPEFFKGGRVVSLLGYASRAYNATKIPCRKRIPQIFEPYDKVRKGSLYKCMKRL